VGDNSESAHLLLQLGELSLDEGKNAEAEEFARRAGVVFEKTKSARYEIAAKLLLARALFSQGKLEQAQQSLLEAATAAGRSHTRELELAGAIVGAHLEAVSGQTSAVSASAKKLEDVKVAAEASGFSQLAMEARLVLGEIETNSDRRTEGRSRLEALQRDSTAAGMQSIARKAAAVLQAEPAKAGGRAGI